MSVASEHSAGVPAGVPDGYVQATGQMINRPRRATQQLLKRLLRTTTEAQLRSLGLVRRRPGARARPRASMPCTPTTPSAIATGVQVDGAVPVGVSIKDGASTTQLRTLH